MSYEKCNEDFLHVDVGLYGRKKNSRLIQNLAFALRVVITVGRRRPYMVSCGYFCCIEVLFDISDLDFPRMTRG